MKMSKTFIYVLIVLGIYFFVVVAKNKTTENPQDFSHDDISNANGQLADSGESGVGNATANVVNKVVNNVRGYTL